MNEIVETPDKISPEVEQAIEEALFLYFTGRTPKIADALTQTKGISVGAFYGLRQTNLDEVLAIQKKARARAREETSDVQMAMDAESLLFSVTAQRAAREGLLEAIPHLRDIATRKVQEVDTGERDKDNNPKIKRIIPYPRDVAACTKILQEIAQDGVLPQRNLAILGATVSQEPEEHREPMIPILGIDSNFTSITARRPDGTEFTAEVKAGDVIEVEENNESAAD